MFHLHASHITVFAINQHGAPMAHEDLLNLQTTICNCQSAMFCVDLHGMALTRTWVSHCQRSDALEKALVLCRGQVLSMPCLPVAGWAVGTMGAVAGKLHTGGRQAAPDGWVPQGA
jgi:hypothetical protein